MYLPGIHDNASTIYVVEYLDSRHGWIGDPCRVHVHTDKSKAERHAADIVTEGFKSRVVVVNRP